MPELPEVEIMARNLDGWMRGHRLKAVEVVDDKLRAEPFSLVTGDTVVSVWRRAKYAVIDFSQGHHLVLHYRMTGKTVLDPSRMRRARLRLLLSEGTCVAFEDTRRFGTVQVIRGPALAAFFTDKRLGPEPWPERRDGRWWSAQLAGLRGPIKPAMMRQERVAGLGNIAATEVCFRAGIHPAMNVPAIEAAQWARIASAVHGFIDHTLAVESGPELSYVNQGGEGSFSVYGHAGAACTVCGAEIVRMVQSGRGTFFCPVCQPLS